MLAGQRGDGEDLDGVLVHPEAPHVSLSDPKGSAWGAPAASVGEVLRVASLPTRPEWLTVPSAVVLFAWVPAGAPPSMVT